MNEDIEEMMYGFGDEWPPNSETTALMEALVKEYIEDLANRVLFFYFLKILSFNCFAFLYVCVYQALEVAEISGKLDKECFQFLFRKDSHKFTRVKKLIEANEELKAVQNVALTDDPFELR